jgi:Putative exonuclease, RdgC
MLSFETVLGLKMCAKATSATMPLRKGNAACVRYQVVEPLPKDVRRWLLRALEALAFVPIDLAGEEDEALGTVNIENSDRPEFEAGTVFFEHHALFAFRFEKLRIAPRAVKKNMDAWRKKFEATERRRPSRIEVADAKSSVRKALRGSAEPVARVVEVSIDLPTRMLTVWTTSRRQVEAIAEALQSRLSVQLRAQVVASFFDERALRSLTPTAALFEGAVS